MAATIISTSDGALYSLDEKEESAALLFASNTLFGRAKEVDQLVQLFSCFHSTCAAGPAPLLPCNDDKNQVLAPPPSAPSAPQRHLPAAVVHGNSGMGKTCLVECALREKVVREYQGYFCSGKFYQHTDGMICDAYSAIMAAFSDLCDLVVQEDHSQHEKDHIQSALGKDVHLLADHIPAIKHFLPQNDGEDSAGTGNNAYKSAEKADLLRFHVACKSFLHAMSAAEHPVVLFIDDIQWADEGSRQLIHTLLQDDTLRNVLFVFAYRDEEAENASKILQNINGYCLDIHLQHLNVGAIEELIIHHLDIRSDDQTSTITSNEVKGLSKVVETKTKGNPFHVQEYLTFVEQEGFITYSSDQGKWHFDMQRLETQTMVPDSLAEILECRIDRLSRTVLNTLRVAAFIGFSFEERVVTNVIMRLEEEHGKSVIKKSEEDLSVSNAVKEALSLAVQEGIIERSSTAKGAFFFNHDSLQSACAHHRFQNRGDASLLEFVIVQVFLDLASVEDGYVHQAAQHVNSAKALFESHYGRIQLIKLHLEAAQYYINRTGFFAASDHLQEGAELWGQDDKRWDQNYELTLELNEKQLELAILLGHFEACDSLAGEILLHSTSEETNINARKYQTLIKLGQGDSMGAIKAARTALQDLGAELPKKVNLVHVVRKFFRVRRLLSKKTDDDILCLPLITNDVSKIAVQRMLLYVAMVSLQDDNHGDSMYASLAALQHTLTEGLSEYSATALAMYAMCETALGNKERGYTYGQLALTISEAHRSEIEIAAVSVVCSLVIHWKEPIRNIVQPQRRVFEAHFPGCNLLFASVAANSSLYADFESGTHLHEIRDTAQRLFLRFQEYKQDKLADNLRPTIQLVHNLTNPYDNGINTATLTGEAMVEEVYMKTCEPQVRNIATLLKLTLAYQFGQYDLAGCALKKLAGASKMFGAIYCSLVYNFYAGMTYIALYRTVQPRRKYLQKMRSHKKQLLKLRAVGCPNSEPLLHILLAEEASLMVSVGADLSKYEVVVEKAVQACETQGFVQYQGLMYERAGFVHAKHNNFMKAAECFDAAMVMYDTKWGSCAKSDWLARERLKVLKPLERCTTLRGKDIEIPKAT